MYRNPKKQKIYLGLIYLYFIITVIGTAFALNILLHIPPWAGVLLTGLSTLLLLGLQKYGAQSLSSLSSSPHKEDTTICSKHQYIECSSLDLQDACRFFLIESGFLFFIAFLINVAVVSVTGTVCFAENLSHENLDQCNNLTLNSASFLLKNVLGNSSSIIYAIALLASGQSSTVTGTYAGQFIMQGFLDLKMKKWARNLMTQTIAIAPSLVVSIIGGPSGAGQLIIISSMILSFELPFSLIPLLKFSSSASKMGPHMNSIFIIVISWILGLCIIRIHVYYLIIGFVDWLFHNSLPKVSNVFIGIFVFPIMALYVLSVLYLTFRKDTTVTFIDAPKLDHNIQTQMEKGFDGADHDVFASNDIVYREDLADIPE
ncbi:hypothetical protein NE237_019242 [Protea cynaroides]|uniref:Uncharacterized protein n=1 Tax=Protea cynaroides TaxID=273540 RepID=A0A9Q0QPT4_9MAGN|nr:hypothetical protein NE237_019242 [Protea cynaroides]